MNVLIISGHSKKNNLSGDLQIENTLVNSSTCVLGIKRMMVVVGFLVFLFSL